MGRCKNCKGVGYHKCNNSSIIGECYYCRGTGIQERKYKQNEVIR